MIGVIRLYCERRDWLDVETLVTEVHPRELPDERDRLKREGWTIRHLIPI